MNRSDRAILYDASVKQELSLFGAILFALGLLCLIPTMLFSFLNCVGTALAIWVNGLPLTSQTFWGAGMSLSFAAFAISSLRMTFPLARFVMYSLGTATILCTMIYDTYHLLSINPSSCGCGNPIPVDAIIRSVCLSTYVGVSLVLAAGLLGTIDLRNAR